MGAQHPQGSTSLLSSCQELLNGVRHSVSAKAHLAWVSWGFHVYTSAAESTIVRDCPNVHSLFLHVCTVPDPRKEVAAVRSRLGSESRCLGERRVGSRRDSPDHQRHKRARFLQLARISRASTRVRQRT